MQTIKDIIYIISTILIPICTFLVGKYRSNKKQNKTQNEALKILLQNALTNVYFVYEKLGEIPDYIYKNWLSMLKVYEALDGDDYIHELAEKMKNWKIIQTNILK